MTELELKALACDCYAALGAALPAANSPAWRIWAEMCRDVPLQAAASIRAKIIEFDAMPRNFGKTVVALGREWRAAFDASRHRQLAAARMARAGRAAMQRAGRSGRPDGPGRPAGLGGPAGPGEPDGMDAPNYSGLPYGPDFPGFSDYPDCPDCDREFPGFFFGWRKNEQGVLYERLIRCLCNDDPGEKSPRKSKAQAEREGYVVRRAGDGRNYARFIKDNFLPKGGA